MILQLIYDPATPLNYFEGELFKVDITCAKIDDGAHKKLMFKYNGTSILTNKGRYTSNIANYACTYPLIHALG